MLRRKLGSLVVGVVEWDLWADFPEPGVVRFKCDTKAPLRKQSFQLNVDREWQLMEQYLPALYDWCRLRLAEYAKKNNQRRE